MSQPAQPAGPGQNDPGGVCARCRRCCTLAPGQEGLVFPLAPADIERLDRLCGHGRWRSPSGNTPEFLAMLARLFPRSPAGLARAFPPEGHHWRLAVQEDGRCFFLGELGCRLDPPERPAHCRLFPVWRLGSQVMPLAVECLAIAEARDMPGLLKSLGLDLPLARGLFAAIQAAWGLSEEPG